MDAEIKPFFGMVENHAVFETAVNKIRASIEGLSENGEEKRRFILNSLGTVFYKIQSRPESFDERCISNISTVGERYVSAVSSVDLNNDLELDFLLAFSYRFVIEYQLSTPHDISSDLLAVVSRVHEFEYDGRAYAQLQYADHQMLIDVVKRYIHHPDLVAIRGLPELLGHAESTTTNAAADLDARELRVNALKENLDTYKTAFNFFGLYDGFSKLRTAKGTESKIGLIVLAILAALMICPFLVKFYITFRPLLDTQIDSGFYVALAGFEIVLAYFFRVALHNFRSIRAQLIQIDLRMALCQFVQDYAVYAKEVKGDSPQLLDRFDQVIFSGIVNDEGAIPSTFDGFDQLANLIEKIKR